MSLLDLSNDERREFAESVRAKYADFVDLNLNLDLTRGKPSAEQLDLSEELLSLPGAGNHVDKTGADLRNYGNLKGIADIRELWAEVLGIPAENLFAADASSLNIMFDMISFAVHFGTPDSKRPWSQEQKVKWICPVPGYDRHFAIAERFGFEMLTVPMLDDGPDLAAVQELAKDPTVKGMFLVPTFANPTGQVTSKEIATGLVSMETGAPDFRIVWDNAYAVHTLTDTFPENYDIVGLAEKAGHPNRVWAFSSTSKITFAGAGVAFVNSSAENLDWYSSVAGIRGIGPNKINQLAHARFFGDAEGLRQLMLKHSAILAPKFQRVDEILESRLGEYEVARWTKPEGGYFVSLDVLDGTASRVVELAKEAGISLTGAGSAYPLHKDPNDSNIRLAPSMPPLAEVETAMDGVATCVLLAAVEKLGA